MNKQQLLKELREEGFSEEIVGAFDKVRREDFVPKGMKEYSYLNEPLSIGKGQTISQPYTIAFMLDLLELDKDKKFRILEVGSGSGYALALINEICKDCNIYGIDRIKEHADKSKEVLSGNKNIHIIYGDGSKGINKKKFDRILVSASAEKIPEKLINSLNDNGILVIPLRNSIAQLKKEKRKIKKIEYPGFIFVPLIEGGE